VQRVVLLDRRRTVAFRYHSKVEIWYNFLTNNIKTVPKVWCCFDKKSKKPMQFCYAITSKSFLKLHHHRAGKCSECVSTRNRHRPRSPAITLRVDRKKSERIGHQTMGAEPHHDASANAGTIIPMINVLFPPTNA
jgi:hypothetical protein